MKISQVSYAPVQPLSTAGFDIQEPVRKFMRQSAIAADASQMVTKYILKQAERDAEDKLISFREQIDKREREITSKRTVLKDNLPEEVNVPEGEGDEVKTSMYGASAFDALSKQDLDAFLSTVPESMRDRFKQAAEGARHQAMGRVFVQTQKWSMDEQLYEFESGLNRLADIGDFPAAIDWTNSHIDIIGAEKAGEIKRQIEIRQHEYPIQQDILAGDIAALKKHIDVLAPKSKDYKGPLDPNRRMAIVNTIKGRIAEITAEREASLSKRHGEILSGLMISLEHGDDDLMDVERVWNMNVGMTWNQKVQATNLYYNRIKSMQKAAASMARVTGAMVGGYKLNYRNPDDKEAVNTYYNNALATSPPEQRLSILTGVLQGTGVIPSAVEDQIVALGQSDKVEDIMGIVQIMGLARKFAPLDYVTIPIRDRAKAESVAALVMSGISPQTAIANTSKISQYTDSQLQIMQKEHESLTSGDSNKTYLTEAMFGDEDFSDDRKVGNFEDLDPWFGDPPSVSPFMQSMFNDTVKAYFMTNGNIELSRKLAFGNIKSEWAGETINGDLEIMHKGPSKVYGMPTEDIRAEFEKDTQLELTRLGIINYTAKDLKLKSWDDAIKPGPDGETWEVLHPIIKLDDGTVGYSRYLYPNGSPMGWSMDVPSYNKRKNDEGKDEAKMKKMSRDAFIEGLVNINKTGEPRLGDFQ